MVHNIRVGHCMPVHLEVLAAVVWESPLQVALVEQDTVIQAQHSRDIRVVLLLLVKQQAEAALEARAEQDQQHQAVVSVELEQYLL